MTKELLEYFKGDELAASTWLNKYAAEGEKTPDDMHKRMAREFARIEKRDSIPMSYDTIYNLFKDFRYIIPAGSVMASLGLDKPVSLSNCFTIKSPKDSYHEIMKSRETMVQLFKRRGGAGVDLSNLRPNGAKVSNAAKTSSGVSSFMEGYSSVVNEVGINGRRAALMLSLSIKHPDVEEFIKIKQDLTKVTGANISVKITDEFMIAVENNDDYILTFPIDVEHLRLDPNDSEINDYNVLHTDLNGTYYKKVKAKELWNKLISCAWNTAEPGIMFDDTMINYAPDGVYEEFKGVTSNPCQPAWATVLTPTGISTIGKINIGDKIWSSECWTTVTNKWSTGVKDVHEYRTTAGSFYGTNTHQIIQKGEKVEARNAETIDVLSGIVCNKNYTLKIQDIMDGLVLGDGSVHKASNNLVYLCIGNNDIDYFDSEIKSLIGNHRKSLNKCAYEIQTTIQACELPKTYDREIPDRFFNGDYVKVVGFLKGLYSANGSVIGQRITLKTTSSKLRDQIQIMLSSIGIRSYYTTNKPNKVLFSNGEYECKQSYDINISTDRNIFYLTVGFLQTYKMEKLSKVINDIKHLDKTADIISDTIISTEEVFDITVDNNSHTYWTGGLNVSNCSEIFMNEDSCRLIHINLTSVVQNPFTKDAYIDWDLLCGISHQAMKLGDCLIDLEIEAIDRILDKLNNNLDTFEYEIWHNYKTKALQGRRVGVGFLGLADVIAMCNLKYDSPESLVLIDRIMDHLFYGQLEASIYMARELGKFPLHNLSLETNLWYDFVKKQYPELYKSMLKYGRRNVSFSTCAPTGTVALMAQCSSGIEPVFMPFYERKRKCNSKEDRVDYTDKLGINYTKFIVVHPKLKEWFCSFNRDNYTVLDTLSLEDWQKLFEKSPYYKSTAQDIDWRQRIKLQGIVQKYITHSISSTINLPKETTKKEVADIYLEAWKAGNKGQTIYRDGCREGVLTSVSTSTTIVDSLPPKRPKKLEADFYSVKVKGEQFVILVGLLDDKPYEVFTFRPQYPINLKEHKGSIIKNKKMHYSFMSEFITIDDLQLANDSIEENAATLYSSMLLRHGVDINYIIKTAKKVNANITSFSSAMCRILSKYITDSNTGERCPDCGEVLTRDSGCIICKSCGYSKCS